MNASARSAEAIHASLPSAAPASAIAPIINALQLVRIFSSRNEGGSISGNRIRGIVGKGLGESAIGLDSNQRMHVTGNEMTGSGRPGSIAVNCSSDLATTANNLANGFGTAFANCRDGGGNFSQ